MSSTNSFIHYANINHLAVLAEFKNGKMAKKRFEEKRVAYEISR